jgi:soluble lytic murein transglycosylase-like protein
MKKLISNLAAKALGTPAERALFAVLLLAAYVWAGPLLLQPASGKEHARRSASRPDRALVRRMAQERRATLREAQEAADNGFTDLDRYRIYTASHVLVPKHVPQRHIAYMLGAARRHGIPPRIMFRLIAAESEYKQHARSHVGARGYMQLMPGTRRELRKTHRLREGLADYKVNIELGAAYLKELHQAAAHVTKSDRRAWRLALAYYNAGPDRVIQNGNRVPDYCRAYVDSITRR